MTAIASILNTAEESIATITGYKVKLSVSRVKDATWQRDKDIDMVLMAVETAYGIDTEKLKSKSRKRPIPKAKRLACMLLKEYIPLISLKDIAREVGLRDHTTVLFHIKKGKGFLQTDGAFIAKYGEAKGMLEGLKTL